MRINWYHVLTLILMIASAVSVLAATVSIINMVVR